MISLPRPRPSFACASVVALLALIPGASLRADEPVVWTNAVGVSVSGNSLTKTGGATAWDAGAATVQTIRAGYAYVESTTTETTTHPICPLTNGTTPQDSTPLPSPFFPQGPTPPLPYSG